MRSTAPIVLRPVLGQFASPYFVLGRQQRSTYTHVRLALLAPSGLVRLATRPSPLGRGGADTDKDARSRLETLAEIASHPERDEDPVLAVVGREDGLLE